MRLCSIASGSSGNCIYVGSEATHLLVDVGISGKKAEAGLNSLGLTGRDLDGILVTHENMKCRSMPQREPWKKSRRWGIWARSIQPCFGK